MYLCLFGLGCIIPSGTCETIGQSRPAKQKLFCKWLDAIWCLADMDLLFSLQQRRRDIYCLLHDLGWVQKLSFSPLVYPNQSLVWCKCIFFLSNVSHDLFRQLSKEKKQTRECRPSRHAPAPEPTSIAKTESTTRLFLFCLLLALYNLFCFSLSFYFTQWHERNTRFASLELICSLFSCCAGQLDEWRRFGHYGTKDGRRSLLFFSTRFVSLLDSNLGFWFRNDFQNVKNRLNNDERERKNRLARLRNELSYYFHASGLVCSRWIGRYAAPCRLELQRRVRNRSNDRWLCWSIDNTQEGQQSSVPGHTSPKLCKYHEGG